MKGNQMKNLRNGILAIALAIASPAMAGDIDLTNYRMIFQDQFKTLDVSDGTTLLPGTKWIDHMPGGDFGAAAFDFASLSIDAAGLHITATQDAGGKWHSGGIATCDRSVPSKGFRDGYGYFEANIKMPVSNGTPGSGDGVWPSFWTNSYGATYFPPGTTKGTSGVELDVFEFYGAPPYDSFWSTWHFRHDSIRTAQGFHVTNPTMSDQSAAYHMYGMLVDPVNTTWYFDGVQVWQAPSAAEFAIGKCVLVDYALGGGWPLTGVINGSHLDVAWVRVWTHK
ncbi:MAG: glycoside hydrolase family 16 protein [Methylocella sp.]